MMFRDVTRSSKELALAQKLMDPFFRKKDGSVSEPHLYQELGDYIYLIQQVEKVYDHVTCGRVQNAGFHADDVIQMADECDEKFVRDAIAEVLDRLESGESVNDIRKDLDL